MVGRDLLEAGVWSFMRILVLLHWTKVGNDKLTMEKLFVGTSLVRERIYDNLLATIGNLEGGKSSYLLYCKITGLPEMCRFTPIIQKRNNPLSVEITIC